MAGAIGDLAIGDVEDAVGSFAASSVCLPAARVLFWRDRILAAFMRRGAENSIVYREAQPGVDVNVVAVWLMTRSEELVGEVRQSDMTVLVHPQAFEGTGFTTPLRKGDRIVRFPGEAREHVFTCLETPGLYTASGVDLLYRLIARG